MQASVSVERTEHAIKLMVIVLEDVLLAGWDLLVKQVNDALQLPLIGLIKKVLLSIINEDQTEYLKCRFFCQTICLLQDISFFTGIDIKL